MAFLARSARRAVPLLAVLLGCGSDSNDASDGLDAAIQDAGADAAPDAYVSTGGCTGTLEACDIREADCQRAISEELACLRGEDAVIPSVRLISEAELVEMLDAPVHHTATQAVWYKGLSSFGLIDLDVTGEGEAAGTAARVAAQYRGDTDEIIVVDRGMPLDDIDTVTVLAHEFVHAYQAHARDVNTWFAMHATSYDRELAALAVTEGEGMHYQQLVGLALLGIDQDGFDWEPVFERLEHAGFQVSDGDPAGPFATSPLIFPYAFGQELVTRAWLSDGRDGIEALYETAPESSRAIMAGEADGEAEARELLYEAALPVANGFVPIAFDALGAFAFRAFLVRHGASDDEALEGALSVGADIFAVQTTPDESATMTTWRVQLLASASTTWLDALTLDDIEVTVDGPVVTFIGGPPAVLQLARSGGVTWAEVPALPRLPGGG